MTDQETIEILRRNRDRLREEVVDLIELVELLKEPHFYRRDFTAELASAKEALDLIPEVGP